MVFAGPEQDVCGIYFLVQLANVLEFKDRRCNRSSKIEASTELRYICSTFDLAKYSMKRYWLALRRSVL